MSAMLREIERGQLPKRRDIPADRWRSWARSLVERYGRTTLRRGTLAFTLAERLRPIYLLSQRWERHTWRLGPQINLAIGAILREMGGKGTSILLARSAESEFGRMPSAADERMTAGERGGSTLAGHDRLQARPLAREHTRALGSSSPAVSLPLHDVFDRFNQRQTVLQVHQGLSAPASFQLVRRVVDERQRVEAKDHRATIVRRQRDGMSIEAGRTTMAAQVGMKASAPAEVGFDLSASTPTQRRTNPNAWPAPPAINIEQVTEQVLRQLDHRILAYRERRGKPV